ncbi:SAM-dependent methyltransferase [Aestuariivirga litoralis]|uniref:SAM-dependent methyltransferase n=1 Tax=Aestuariivirga litoralis TaxID=2650924 RepID=A0A2W2APN9_9HYPH|nr:cyclopropane-fatty-acyl-phospholipid synthase family protein [Aestuariivirga litoralis]PZF77365.1 SAM-dependent methyltransferase [Aestuariivirga litoralis]
MTTGTLHARESLVGQAIAAAGRRLLPRDLAGGLTLTLPSGRQHRVGFEKPGIQCDLTLRNFRPVLSAMRRGAVGFGESFILGDLESSDITAVLRFYLRNREALNRAGKSVFFKSLGDRLFHLLRQNTKAGARRNISAHYDLGNAFYALWLDPTMSYSSGLFGGGAETLQASQVAKYERVVDALCLERPSEILEIGCGWGGFAEAAAEHGHRVTGLTISREQLEFARHRLGERADIRFEDYRDTTGQFDAIASIEMIEAVGEANWPTYFKVLHDRLKPGGRAAVQAITIADSLYDGYRRKADFIQRYIFPGGMLPTKSILAEQARRAGLSFEPVVIFGQDYARTLALWRERFEAAWPEIERLGFDARFRRRWVYYLSYCEAGFREGSIDVGIYRFHRTL